jgi:hypothetical protein
MMTEPHFPDLFVPEQTEAVLARPLPATEKQAAYAKALAQRSGTSLPGALLGDRSKLSEWIDRQKSASAASKSQFSNYPSSKQVAFAERIARIKRRDIPRECFRDKAMMSKWIEGNKPG